MKKDKSLLRIYTSHLSEDFALIVQENIQHPQENLSTLSWITISQYKENAISPAIQKPEILDVDKKTIVSEEISASNVRNLELRPGQAASLFNDAFIKRTDLSMHIKDSLKYAINQVAEATNTSSSAVIESLLRNTFPDSWDSDLAKQFHERHMPPEVLSVAKKSYSKQTKGVYSEIEFSLPDKLINYIVDNIHDGASFFSFVEAVEQALELGFQGASPLAIDHKIYFDQS